MPDFLLTPLECCSESWDSLSGYFYCHCWRKRRRKYSSCSMIRWQFHRHKRCSTIGPQPVGLSHNNINSVNISDLLVVLFLHLWYLVSLKLLSPTRGVNVNISLNVKTGCQCPLTYETNDRGQAPVQITLRQQWSFSHIYVQ